VSEQEGTLASALLTEARELKRRIAAYDRLITQAIDAMPGWQTPEDVQAFLLYGLPGCRE
jgi:hypothetical protein